MATRKAPETKEEKLALIYENLAETINPEIIEGVLDEGRNVKVYWGTATTGKPHTGYFVPAIKIAQLLHAGCEVTILLADIHGFLDNLKAPLELVEHRSNYYQHVIRAMLEAVGVDTSLLKFVKGSSYQKSPDYIMDVYRLCSVTSEHDAKKAGAEVVKQSTNAPLSGLLYPILQILDEEHLGVDVQFGGVDQRKLFTAAKEWLPKLGYKQRAHIMNPMIPGLHGGKMSSSEEDSKIDLLDSAETISKKIRKAEAAPKIVEGNGILAFIEYVLLPAAELKTGTRSFTVDRSRDSLEPLVYTDIKAIHADYQSDVLTPQLIKPAVAQAIVDLTAHIRDSFAASPEWQNIAIQAYPPPKKKEKKVKDKGTHYPVRPKADAAAVKEAPAAAKEEAPKEA
ncbi:Tyrosine--tRNA ligase cytoplasmic [Sporothrix eucalyptigena]|uniref:Tyrosine--tRNA ligase n=1 Tax=Sporothrix eucalyptigena TaxID=1812306 RepID=A0ABP0ALZ6_9PEZI